MADYLTNDPELWNAFRQGDEQAFAQIYRNYVKVLYRYGLKITPDTSLIEDCIQDLFIEIWGSRARLSETDSIKFYLFRVMRRKIYKRLTRQSSTSYDSLEVASELTVDSFESILIQDQEATTYKDKLHQALTLLPIRQREAINLRFFHGFSYEQVADIMDINLQSVHNTIQKAMKLLRAHLATFMLLALASLF
jgi:RNA polymerase sigma-70 factor (ECF subfamily)